MLKSLKTTALKYAVSTALLHPEAFISCSYKQYKATRTRLNYRIYRVVDSAYSIQSILGIGN